MKIEDEISDALSGQRFRSIIEVDELLCHLDGNPDKSRVGTNSTIAVSRATARAMAFADPGVISCGAA